MTHFEIVSIDGEFYVECVSVNEIVQESKHVGRFDERMKHEVENGFAMDRSLTLCEDQLGRYFLPHYESLLRTFSWLVSGGSTHDHLSSVKGDPRQDPVPIS